MHFEPCTRLCLNFVRRPQDPYLPWTEVYEAVISTAACFIAPGTCIVQHTSSRR